MRCDPTYYTGAVSWKWIVMRTSLGPRPSKMNGICRTSCGGLLVSQCVTGSEIRHDKTSWQINGNAWQMKLEDTTSLPADDFSDLSSLRACSRIRRRRPSR